MGLPQEELTLSSDEIGNKSLTLRQFKFKRAVKIEFGNG
jgi:hypothetical protein